MLGYLLARSGVQVTILEKHRDFFRDFRGDTVHPSTLKVMHELGLLEGLLQLPHQKVTSVRALFGGFPLRIADLTGLKTRCPFVALMPQWDFLNFLSQRGKQHPEFDLRMEHEAIDLIHEGPRVSGVLVRTPTGTERVFADLVVACDGRHSELRAAAGLQLDEIGVPIDVLWFRISRKPEDPEPGVVGNIDFGKVLVLLNRGDYFQAGLIIRKDSFSEIREQGLDAFRTTLSRIAPYLQGRLGELKDWEQIKLLSVQINRLRRWYKPGFLCLGDAAHAMSPAFGVGINLAIQDAVAAANLLTTALQRGADTDALLHRLQCRREFPTRATQLLQVLAHKGLEYIFRQHGPMHPPLPLRLAVRIPGLQRGIARMVGIGIRPEHVTPPQASRLRKVAAVFTGIAAGVAFAWRGFRTAGA